MGPQTEKRPGDNEVKKEKVMKHLTNAKKFCILICEIKRKENVWAECF